SAIPNAPLNTVITFWNDSAKREVKFADSTSTRLIGNVTNAIPYMNNSQATYEIGTMWMKSTKRDAADLKLLQLGAPQPIIQATSISGNRAKVNFFGDLPLYLTIDNAGHILAVDGSQTTLKVSATRLPSVDLKGLAQSFASR